MKLGTGQVNQTLAGGTPQLPGVPGFDPLQTQGQQGVVDKSTGSLQTMAGNLSSAQNFLTGDVMDINKNAAHRQALDATLRPISENFRDVVMPGLRTEAINAGALGSPKGNTRGQIAGSNLNRDLGEASAKFNDMAYGRNLDAMTKGVALAPQSMQASLFPEAALESVGSQRRELTAQQGSQGFNQQMLPFNMGLQLISAAGAAPGAGSTSTVNPAQPKSDWTQLLGTGISALAGLPFFA